MVEGRSMRHMHAGLRSTIGILATVAGALLLSASAGIAQSAAPSTGQDQAGGTVFMSKRSPYVVTLPAGWRVLPVTDDPTQPRDAFATAGASATVQSAPRPGQTVEDRVAATRAEVGPPCTSDPANDQSTLDGEHAIVWSYRCPDSAVASLQAIHNDISSLVRVSVPPESESDLPSIVEQFRGAFQFVDAQASPTASDLAEVDAQLRGTWTTEWFPVALALATIRAAGLEPGIGEPRRDWWEGVLALDPATTWRFGVKLVDAHTIQASEGGVFNKIVYDFDIRDGVLSIDVVSDSDPADLIPQTAIYETLPFTRVP
jgi:hypothetical protein